jgi:diacylglycerol kinase (ATP)
MIQADASNPLHLVINPKSGYGGRKRMLAELRRRIESLGLPLVEYETRCAGDATQYARSVKNDAAAILSWGGDGTVNEIANGLAGSDVPILPIPAGTENLLAQEMRVPKNPRDIVEILRAGTVLECDVGEINDRRFLLIMGVGFDGEVVRRLTTSRRGHISHLSYFWPIWRTFWEHDFPRMKVNVDGEDIFDDYGLAFVGNISRYAVGLRICRDARFDDGLLDLVIFRCREQTGLMLHAAWTLLRLHPLKGDVLYRRCRNATIETPDGPTATQVDGDPGPSTPLHVSVAPFRMHLLVPEQPDSWGWPWGLLQKHVPLPPR